MPLPVFLPGKSHGQRSLEGYSPWGHKSQTLLITHAFVLRTMLCPQSYHADIYSRAACLEFQTWEEGLPFSILPFTVPSG